MWSVPLLPSASSRYVAKLSLGPNSAVKHFILYVNVELSNFRLQYEHIFERQHEREIRARSRTSEQTYVALYHVYTVTADIILAWICEVQGIIIKSRRLTVWLFVRAIHG
jgi:hypothetical protein